MKILFGLIMMAIGTILVMKTEFFFNTFGRIDFFDRYLGTEGGSRLGYKVIGMIFVFLGILLATGLFGGFMTWMLGPLLRAGQQ